MPQAYSTATLGLRINAQQFNKELGATSSGFQHSLDKMKLSADAFGDKWDKATSGIKDTKRIVSGILVSQGFYALSGALIDGSAALFNFSKNMETAKISMEYFVDGADKAAKAVAYLREINTFAARTPFTTEEALSMSKYMQAVGISMNNTKSVLGVITDAAAATGATDENLQRIVFALGQMKTKGRIANEEIRQMANANIPIYEILQEELGLTGAQISNIGKYWVDADKAIVAILDGLEKRYDGAADKVSDTVTGMLDTLADNAKIIANEAMGGIYESVAGALTKVRDLTDEYRETVTNEGSMGLFNKVMLDIDPTGQVGTQILALVGNFRQLGGAVKELAVSASPLLNVFGKGLFASINVATVTISSFAHVADGLIGTFEKLGISSGALGKVLSSLYITYKAASWMGTLGQAAVSAAYSLYSTAKAATSILPATLSANAGVTALTASLAGLISYGMAAYGIFSMLNNMSAGLDVSVDGGSGLPSDYTTEFTRYEAAMKEYNDSISKYQEDFTSPYSNIVDGTDGAVDSFNTVADASKKAAGSVASDWTAAFDEVYSIPNSNGGGGSSAAGALADLGAFLSLPSIKFPTIEMEAPEMPEFDWSKVYEGSPFDTDVLKADWWKSLLPAVLVGAAVKLGQIMSRNAASSKLNDSVAGLKLSDAIYNDTSVNIQARKVLARQLSEIEFQLRKVNKILDNPTAIGELRIAAEANLEKLVEDGSSALTSLNNIERAILVNSNKSTITTSSTIADSIQRNAFIKIQRKVDSLEEAQNKMLDAGYAATAAGQKTAKDIENIQRTLTRDFGKYIGRYGNDAGLETLLRSFDIKITSINEALEKLYAGMDILSDLTKDQQISDLAQANRVFKEVQSAVDFLSASPYAEKEFVKGVADKIEWLGKAIKAESALASNTELLRLVTFLQQSRDALKNMGEDMSTVAGILTDTEEQLRKTMAKSQSEAGLYRLMYRYLDVADRSAVISTQAQINANKSFMRLVNETIGRELGGIVGELVAIEHAGVSNLRRFGAGMSAINKVNKQLDNLLNSAGLKQIELFRPIIEEIYANTSILTDSTGELVLNIRDISDIVKLGLQEIADNTNADAQALREVFTTYNTAAKSGIASLNKTINSGMDKLAEAANAKSLRTNLDTPSDIFYEKIFSAFNEKLYNKNGINAFGDILDDIYDEIQTGVRELAKAENWNVGNGADFFRSKQALKVLSDAEDYLKDIYNDFYGTKAATVSDTTQVDLANTISKIGADVQDIPKALADKFGTGIRTGADTYIKPLLEANKEIAEKLSVIADAGIFKPGFQAITGVDLGPTSKGLSSFGKGTTSALIDDLSSEFISLFREPVDTVVNLIPRTIGIEAEAGFARIVSSELQKIGESTYKTSSYINEGLNMLAQLDVATGKKASQLIPTDLKLLDAAKLDEMLKAAEGYSKQTGKVIRLTADGVRRLSEVSRDYVLQATMQAMIVGKGTTRLAVGNRSNTLDPYVKHNVLDKIDLTADNGKKQFSSAVREGVKAAFEDEATVNKLAESLIIFEWKPLKEDRQLIEQLADSFIEFKYLLSKKYLDGVLTKNDIVEILQPRLTTGQALPDSFYRFIGSNYNFNGKGIPHEIIEVVTEQTKMLKSGDLATAAVARQRILNVADAILDAVNRAPAALKEAGEEIKAVFPAFNAKGTYKEVSATTDTLLTAVNRLSDYVDVFKGYDLSAITQFTDKLAQIKKLSMLGVPSDTVINKTLGTTFKELISQTAAMAKNLEKIYGTGKGISTSLFQMASQGTVGSLDSNPFKVMNIFELTDFVRTAGSGLAAERVAIEALAKSLADEAKSNAEAMYEAAKATKEVANSAEDIFDKDVKELLDKEIAANIKNAATESQVASFKLVDAADNINDAANASAKAADSTADAANALNNATKYIRPTADTDALLEVFKNTVFDADTLYTILRDEGAGNGIKSYTISGSQLQKTQQSGRAGYERATILDQAGKIAYSPTVETGDNLTKFFSTVDDILKGINSTYSFIDGFDMLRAATSVTEKFYDTIKRSAIQVDATDAIETLLKDAGVNRGTIAKVISSNMDAIVAAYRGESSLDDIAKTLIKEIDPKLVDEALSKQVATVISDTFTANKSLLNTAAGEAVGDALEKVFENSDVVDVDAIIKAYDGLSTKLIENLNAQGITLGKKATQNITKYYETLLGSDGGLGIPVDDLARYVKKSAGELGWNFIRKNKDAVAKAIDITVDDVGSTIKNALGELPKLEVSDEVLEAAERILARSADDIVADTANVAARGISKVGSVAVSGALNMIGPIFEAFTSSGSQKRFNASLLSGLNIQAETDAELASAIQVLQDKSVSIGTLLSGGKSKLSAMFGDADLSNTNYQGVGVETGIAVGSTALEAALAALLTGASGGSVAGWIGAGVGALASLIYQFGGGKSPLNQSTDAYMEAVANDTIYKNAVKTGMTDKQARAISDALLTQIEDSLYTSSTSNLFNKDDIEKILYGSVADSEYLMGNSDIAKENRLIRLKQATGEMDTVEMNYKDIYYGSSEAFKKFAEDTNSNGFKYRQTDNVDVMTRMLDRVFKQGDYGSELARKFLSALSDEELDVIGNSEKYGSAVEVYKSIDEFIAMLQELGVVTEDYTELLKSGKMGGVVQTAIAFLDQYTASINNQLSLLDKNPGAIVNRELTWNATDDDKADDAKGKALYDTYAAFNESLAKQLAEEYGISVKASISDVASVNGNVVKELYTSTALDMSKLKDKLLGWTVEVPDKISFDTAMLSANDIEVLAQAGIQINSDGTITFMKALNENVTGTDRQSSLTAADLSADIIDILKTAGLNINAGSDKSQVSLDTSALSKSMSGAMFKTTLNAASEVSAYQKEILAGLGTVLDSGFIQINNKAVLSGKQTIAQYLNGLGASISALSPEIQEELARIDNVIAQGGAATSEAVAEWADGIVVPSPFPADKLTEEMRAGMAELGVSFVESGDELLMVINHVGNQLRDGVTIIPEDTWSSLSESVKIGLKALGVTWETEAGYVKVDISRTLGSMVDIDSVDDSITSMLDRLGYSFETNCGTIVGIVDQFGNDVSDGLITIPHYLASIVTPEVEKALTNLGITMTETEDGIMLDMNAIMSLGIGRLVSLFTEQPEMWNQIPEAIKQTLINAGYVTADGLLQINATTLTGLQQINDTWVGFWENMSPEVKQAFDKTGVNTKEGCFMISKYIDESSIPDSVNYVIKKFDELPESMQDAIEASGEAISENGYIVYDATADMVANMENAILANKNGAVTAARTMAQEVSEAIKQVLLDIQQLERAQALAGKGSVGSNGKSYSISNGKGGFTNYTYYPKYDKKGNQDGYIVFNDTTGASKAVDSLTNLKPFASGGTTPGKNLPILAGELGTEMAILPDGSIQMLGADGKGTLVDLPKGTRILNAEDTQEALKYTGPVDHIEKYATGNTSLAISDDDDAMTTLTKLVAQLVTYFVVPEDNKATYDNNWLALNLDQAIRGATAAVAELISVFGTTTKEFLTAFSSDVIAAIEKQETTISSAISSMRSMSNQYSKDYSLDANTDAQQYTAEQIQSVAETIAAAKKEWAEATTDEARKAAHQKAEDARGTLGYAGGDAGDENIGGAQDVVDSVNTLVNTLNAAMASGNSGSGSIARITDPGWTEPVTGSASGSLVTKDALYRAGELGLNEAIIPLERPSIMNKVGSTIADYIPSATPVVNVGLTAENIASVAAAICGPLLNDKPLFVDSFSHTIRGAVAAILEQTMKDSAAQSDDTKANTAAITTKLETMSSAITGAISNMSSSLSSLRSSSYDKSDNTYSTEKTTAEIIAEAKAEWNAATTQEARDAAHLKAELARATEGYSGGDDGSEHIDLSKIKGSAGGSLVKKDALYRAGELGLNEAILPLERPTVMKQVGAAIASFMPNTYDDDIRYARSMQNAGVVAASSVNAMQQQQMQMASMADRLVQQVLESVLPAMSYNDTGDDRRPLYVGTLVADDSGLKQLERKLRVIRQSEESRRK